MKKVLYLLGQLQDDDLNWLSVEGVKRIYSKGEQVIQAGKEVTDVLILLKRACGVYSDLTAIDELNKGDILGEMSFLEGVVPNVTVFAKEEMIVLSISHSDLESRIKQNTGFASRWYKAIAIVLSGRLRNLVAQQHPTLSSDKSSGTEANELTDAVLDTVHLAGERFEALCQKVLG